MNKQHSTVSNKVEEMIYHLSHKEQLRLIEKLAHCLQESSIASDMIEQTVFKNQLIAMAADTEIQAELQKIEQEFNITERDGLEPK